MHTATQIPRLILLAAATLALACTSAGNPERSRDTAPITAQPAIETPTSGITRFPEEVLRTFRYNSGFEERERLVIRDSATWAVAWDKLIGSGRPKAAVPNVDFNRHRVLIASSGTKNTGGYTILIERYEGGTAHVLFVSPGRSCGTTAALTEPADAVMVPRTSAPVQWADRDSTHECR